MVLGGFQRDGGTEAEVFTRDRRLVHRQYRLLLQVEQLVGRKEVAELHGDAAGPVVDHAEPRLVDHLVGVRDPGLPAGEQRQVVLQVVQCLVPKIFLHNQCFRAYQPNLRLLTCHALVLSMLPQSAKS